MFSGSIVALITPFKSESKEVDYSAVEKLVEFHLLNKSDAIVVAGTTGEGPTLSKDEFCELLSFIVERVKNQIPVIANSGTNCTKTSLEMTLLAKKLGASGALVIVPYYNKPTDQGVIEHFREIGKANLPLIVYHHPGRTGIELDLETLVALFEFDFVVGLKECSKNRALIRELLEKSKRAHILTGDDENLIEMMQMGAKGSISVVANLFPDSWKQIIDLCLRGCFDEAKSLFKEIKPILWALSLEVNPQCIKYAMSLEGYCENVLRLPLISVIEDTKEEIEEVLGIVNQKR